MARHRRANSLGQNSVVHLHLKEKNRSFEDKNGNIFTREDKWFERGVKESIYVKLEWPPLKRGVPDSLITIHTWTHLTLATQMTVGWVNDPQEALTTLKLRAHMCP